MSLTRGADLSLLSGCCASGSSRHPGKRKVTKMTVKKLVPSTYPETLARARRAPAGAEVPDQSIRAEAAAHVGQEVGPAPAAPPAEEED